MAVMTGIAGIFISALAFCVNIGNGQNIYSFDDGQVELNQTELTSLIEELKLYSEATDSPEISNITKINFEDEGGYFIEFSEDNIDFKSVLIKGDFNNYDVYAIYEPGIIPFEENEKYCLSPFIFISNFNKFTDEYAITTSSIDYTWGGVTYGGELIDKNLYPQLTSVNEHLSFYSSSYLNETKIKNVPNYMNTQYNHNGCTPTTAAMYFAYLEDNVYSNICDYKDLPLLHTDNTTKVNNFIKYLGDYYFGTDNGGTNRLNIPAAYENYFDDHGLVNYYCTVSKSYSEFQNSILRCAMPVPISIFDRHSVLGIGYRELFNGTENDRFLIANYVKNDTMSEVMFSVDIVRQFYFLHRWGFLWENFYF